MMTECAFPPPPSAPAPDFLRFAVRPARDNRADGDGDEVDGDAGRESACQPAE